MQEYLEFLPPEEKRCDDKGTGEEGEEGRGYFAECASQVETKGGRKSWVGTQQHKQVYFRKLSPLVPQIHSPNHGQDRILLSPVVANNGRGGREGGGVLPGFLQQREQ